MKYAAFLLFAAASLRFDIADLRGKRVSGISVQPGNPDSTRDGWRPLRLTRVKQGMQIIWPYDALVKEADGPGAIPVVVGDPKAANDPHVAAGELLRGEKCDASGLAGPKDTFGKGIALLCAGKSADATEPLGLALQERERQLTRVPSEIYAAAMLYGMALLKAGEFDRAAVAFLKALHERPSDRSAMRYRAEALTQAGKPEAAAAQ